MFIIFGISAYDWLEISEIVVDAIYCAYKSAEEFFCFSKYHCNILLDIKFFLMFI